jgi:hypothetical protein
MSGARVHAGIRAATAPGPVEKVFDAVSRMVEAYLAGDMEIAPLSGAFREGVIGGLRSC